MKSTQDEKITPTATTNTALKGVQSASASTTMGEKEELSTEEEISKSAKSVRTFKEEVTGEGERIGNSTMEEGAASKAATTKFSSGAKAN